MAVEIQKQNKFNKCFNVVEKKGEFIQDSKANRFEYKYYPFRKGTFFNDLNWENIPPLNRKLLEDMSVCEAEVLHMLERYTLDSVDYQLYETRKNYYFKHLRYWNHFLDINEIDVFYADAITHVAFDHIIYHLCKLKNIPVYMFTYGFAPLMAYLSEDIKNPIPDLPKVYDAVKQEYKGRENEIKLNPILQNVVDSYWYKQPLKYPPVVIPKKKKSQERKMDQGIIQQNRDYYNSLVKKKVRLKKKYLYFPLQYQYEASTVPMAGVFSDLIFVAEILSEIGVRVYVKEHPRDSQNRSKQYYDRLANLPNIRLVPIETDHYQLIDNSLAVVSAASTVGWEAALRGKPTLMFGFRFYQYFDNMFRINNVDDAIHAVNNAKPHTREDVLVFLKALDQFVFQDTMPNRMNALNKKLFP